MLRGDHHKVGQERESAPSTGNVRPVTARATLVTEASRIEERRARFESMWQSAEDL